MRNNALVFSSPAPLYDLRVLGPSDVEAFRSLRLEALSLEPRVFAASRKEEDGLSPKDWEKRVLETDKDCWIGVFDSAGNLVGITQVAPWTGDPDGRSAVFRSSYVRFEHRGRQLAGILCKAREKWAKGKYDTAFLFHREHHWIQKVVTDFGAVYSHTEIMQFADGEMAPALWYRKVLESGAFHVDDPQAGTGRCSASIRTGNWSGLFLKRSGEPRFSVGKGKVRGTKKRAGLRGGTLDCFVACVSSQ